MFLGVICSPASADIFHLRAGGQIDGHVIKRGERGEYIIKTNQGATLTLSSRQVAKVDSHDDTDMLYQARSRATPDTVEGHRELAHWCKTNRRNTLAKWHQQRILELDPNDQAARLSLGFQKHQGQWLTRDQIMAAQGMQKYGGKYRTAQDIALREQTKRLAEIENEWFQNIRIWVGWLTKRKSTEALDNISRIDDPHAAVAIVKVLEKQDNQRVRDLLIETLAELRSPLAVTTLVDFSLNDPDPEVRLQCLEYLIRFHQPIQLEPYVQALNDGKYSNDIINRSAIALSTIGNSKAISPLIDALVTTHSFKNTDAPPGNFNTSFGTGAGGGGGGLSLGGNKSKVVNRDVKNLSVRQALVELSGGQDFGFDEKTWRLWYINKQIPDFVDTRRDQ